MRQFMLFFSGKKDELLRQLTRDMARAAREKRFEDAARLRNRVFALEHIQDVALITKDDVPRIPVVPHGADFIDVNGRLEAYDIAHISGTSNVASMAVFVNGKPEKSSYRKFRIKGFEGANDVAAMQEVLRRRLQRNARSPEAWPLPDVMIIDGGELQVAAAAEVLDAMQVRVPIIGIAKGFDRKQDRLVYDESNDALRRIAAHEKDLLAAVRDEAHRFAGAYHRVLRSKRSLGIAPRKKLPPQRGGADGGRTKRYLG